MVLKKRSRMVIVRAFQEGNEVPVGIAIAIAQDGTEAAALAKKELSSLLPGVPLKSVDLGLVLLSEVPSIVFLAKEGDRIK